MIIRSIFTIFTLFLIDVYSYQAFVTIAEGASWMFWAYWAVHIVVYMVVVLTPVATLRNWISRKRGYFLFSLMLTFYVPKVLVVTGLFGEDIYRLGYNLVQWGIGEEMTVVPRSFMLHIVMISLSTLLGFAMLHGSIWGKYRFKIHRIKVPIPDLPSVFHGFTITQISDIHTGSWDDTDKLRQGIELANAQNSDVICFTGDLVNNLAREVDGLDDVFSILEAKEGVYSILGNHDYGDYTYWENREQKQAHFKGLTERHQDFGWDLLQNEARIIERKDHKLAIIGVENWSNRFSKYGDLGKAIQGVEAADVKVLMSHDPSHWKGEITQSYPDIDLTLSGHTHGFQFGFELGPIRWSPARFVYNQWAGLYQQGRQYLYVNRGFGFIGYAGRVGIWPEITVLELLRETKANSR